MRPCHCLGGRSITGQLDSIAEMVAVELVKERRGGRRGKQRGSFGSQSPVRVH